LVAKEEEKEWRSEERRRGINWLAARFLGNNGDGDSDGLSNTKGVV
jgi:hypothetical protein